MGASIVSLIEACFYVYKVRKHYLMYSVFEPDTDFLPKSISRPLLA